MQGKIETACRNSENEASDDFFEAKFLSFMDFKLNKLSLNED